ncbi:salicylate synthase [Pseudoalteromonas tunicata]|uniref:salicylate synthase n=1 Tax=Pseudoalteromonas tunicata TaxID=314281 RepID=UPI00273E95F1|nr:salicylate synthase [Pseudoalteromonas tunicata]MDP5215400.1 salicylate synthase [Pseudoalteromonas tunicata]
MNNNENTINDAANEDKSYFNSGYWQHQLLGDLVTQWDEKFTTRIALTEANIQVSYSQLAQHVSILASGFHQLGIKQGDTVMVQLPNNLDFVYSCFALFQIGAIPILAMPAQRESDILALCQVALPRAYIVAQSHLGHDFLAMAKKVKASCSSIKNIIVSSSLNEIENGFTITRLLKQPIIKESFLTSNIAPTDTALMLLSGGTTGTPKLIPRRHCDYYYNATASAELCQLDQNTNYLAVLPIAHNFPLACPGILGTLSVGGKVVMCSVPSPDEAFTLIAQHEITHTAIVPAIAKLWLEAKQWDTTDLSSLRLIQVGGAKLTEQAAKEISQQFNCQLQQVFGMAEGLLCYTRLDDNLEVIHGSQGRPLCDADQIRIVDDNNQLVELGQIGELQTKGPYTIREYYNAEQYNQQAFTQDGFYCTGDLVRITPQGNLVVEGRIKEQINRAGEKIAVAEVEELLRQHPQIDEAILVPVPDQHLGERSCACLIANSEINLQQIHEFLNDKKIARYKYPDQVIQLHFWPLTAVGKINKTTLIGKAQQQPLISEYFIEQAVDITTPAKLLATSLIEHTDTKFKAIYEHKQQWSVAIGKKAEVTSNGQSVTVSQNGYKQDFTNSDFPTLMANALDSLNIKNWRLYGAAQFELASVFHDLTAATESDTALQLFIPEKEIRITNNKAILRASSLAELSALASFVKSIEQLCQQQPVQPLEARETTEIHTLHNQQYKESVATAIAEIKAKKYQKVILSRRIQLPDNIDLLNSYRLGRANNSPARSFLYQLDSFAIAGFSPETLLEANEHGFISTQPLAGTRALGDSPEQEKLLREELLNDTKEIAEHAVSVKLAQEELMQVCEKNSINICEFMSIRRRGSVQHLASRVTGQLDKSKNVWHAFAALFPAVTASGIPKRSSIDAIQRLETDNRQWYSGSVMIIDENGFMDAALVLRSIYRHQNKVWLQAGAGVIDQSTPERELTETIEKLSCIGNYLVTEVTVAKTEKC